MRALSAHTLFAIAAAVLLSSDLSCAGPTQSGASSSSSASLQASAQSDLPPSYDLLRASPAQSISSVASESSWPNQPGLHIERWHPEGENGVRTAFVNYNGESGLLKCTPHENQHKNEVAVLTALKQAIGGNSVLQVPDIIDTFQTNDNYHCLVLETINGYSMRERVFITPEHVRDVATFGLAHLISRALADLHEFGFTHGNITPDTVYLQLSKDDDSLQVVLTGFEGSQVISELPQPSIVKPRGYSPPEDYIESEIDQLSRDSWMFGATLYFMASGKAPYGFAYSKNHKAMLPVPTKELKETMKRVLDTGKNSCPPIKTKNERLVKQIECLMKPQPHDRDGACITQLKGRPGLHPIQISRKQVMQIYWGLLKERLPIIGKPSWQVEPPREERAEDTSTRYKNP
ncbi:kinase-like domain-containing protein [Thamnocephalis sphaerospora]|uniref:Kinase-like domain-containing protein n=1 Tax=Thamnocephalis sphaerospora TaxID=78915 RepID=A0A4P9XLB6_9FUNG|nr:kinase-like domain-containing protein [Thamnocephalis sphaerospora]|eukprot:RKP06592.1 kinase-like domain-containing protein [Thamnocephalis sphaerospora]